MTAQDHVFVAWQCPATREILSVGRLLERAGSFEFTYIRATERAQTRGFKPFVAFPELSEVYRSHELPALFRNRVMPATRPDYPEFVKQMALPDSSGPLQLLARSGGRRMTDRLEVFAPPHVVDGKGREVFALVRGVRHVPHAEETIAQLREGHRLLVLRNDQNPYGPHARMLRTLDAGLVGFLPDYLASELSRQSVSPAEIEVFVEKVNLPPRPVHHRVLCRIALPLDCVLFVGEDYQPLPPGATVLAA